MASMVYVAGIAAIEQALNGVLALDPQTRERLRELDGKVIAVVFKGLGTTLYFTPEGDRLRVMGYYDGRPDTVLRGTPLAFMRLRTGDAAGGLFGGEVSVEGDVELGQRLQRLLDRVDLDWEEHLSRLTGDVVAHQVGSLMRGAFAWGRNAVDSLRRDAGEYLQEEVQLLPAKGEVAAFLGEVDRLRDDADRLEARIRQLHKATAPGG